MKYKKQVYHMPATIELTFYSSLAFIQHFSSPQQNLETVYPQPEKNGRKRKDAQGRKNLHRAQIEVPKLVTDEIRKHKKGMDTKQVKQYLQ